MTQTQRIKVVEAFLRSLMDFCAEHGSIFDHAQVVASGFVLHEVFACASWATAELDDETSMRVER